MKRFKVLAVLGLSAVLVAACGSDDKSSSTTAAPATSASATTVTATGASTTTGGSASETTGAGATTTEGSVASGPAEKIKIGFIAEQSGAVAVVGNVAVPAVDMAVKKINDAGGFVVDGKRYEFELEVKDDKSDASAASAAAIELTEDEGVKFILGPTTSDTAPGVAQLVLPKGVIMMSPATALDSLLTGDQISGDSATLFRTNWSLDGYEVIHERALKEAFPDAKTIALVASDSGSSKATMPAIKQAISNLGWQTVADETVPAGSTDFQTVLTKVKQTNPDVLYVCCETALNTGIIKQANELGITAAVFYPNQPMSIVLKDAIGGPLPVKSLVTFQPIVLEETPAGELLATTDGAKQFQQDLKDIEGKDLAPGQGIAFYYYDYPALLAAAMQQAGTVTDTKAIAKALETVTVDGAIGKVGFTAGHVSNAAGDICVTDAGSDAPKCTSVGTPDK